MLTYCCDLRHELPFMMFLPEADSLLLHECLYAIEKSNFPFFRKLATPNAVALKSSFYLAWVLTIVSGLPFKS